MRTKAITFLLLVISSPFIFHPILGSARVIIVRKDNTGDYDTITDAVAAAIPFDTIEVGPGKYPEYFEVNFTLTFVSTDGPENTIIDGNGIHRHIVFWGGAETEISGFTFIDGYHTNNGGSVRVGSSAWVTLRDCVFENNVSTYDGGAIVVANPESRSEIDKCTFIGNHAHHKGGAAAVLLDGEMRITNCTFCENSAQEGGGALVCASSSRMEVFNNLFYENSAVTSGCIYYYVGAGHVWNNTFYSNVSPDGATINIHWSPTVTILRNIFCDDSEGFGLAYMDSAGVHACNLFWSNEYGAIQGDPLGPADKIDDPCFCNPDDHNFKIADISPASPDHSLCSQLIGAFPVGCTVTGIEEPIPSSRFALCQNYPNPFSPTTTISFTVPENSFANLSIYDVEGKLIKVLFNEAFGFDRGVREFTWDGTDARGALVGSGVYFYRLRAGHKALTRKMILLK
ncbi:MAG: T9SS type A sorting domain-containing protein [Candidatus Latescibacteria bacterium]|nr:T9SS type A sorting domain-containing protein [Candidatus Latescibacterota bacterium]NIO55210.1 T9SS type A sorting domain-containing protein [Candidatus Latescibacterota bacterium]